MLNIHIMVHIDIDWRVIFIVVIINAVICSYFSVWQFMEVSNRIPVAVASSPEPATNPDSSACSSLSSEHCWPSAMHVPREPPPP